MRINALREELIGFAGLLELELDFAEEDVEFADREKFDALLAELLERISRLADSFRHGNAIREGVPVAILGAPNRGKSTLLNALLGDDRAIVSATPGTTGIRWKTPASWKASSFGSSTPLAFAKPMTPSNRKAFDALWTRRNPPPSCSISWTLRATQRSIRKTGLAELNVDSDTTLALVWNKTDAMPAPEQVCAEC